MTDAQQAADDALQGCESLTKLLKKKTAKQVWALDERATVKATCLAWFNNQRHQIVPQVTQESLQKTDNLYNGLLMASGRAASRAAYQARLKELHTDLLEIRSKQMLNLGKQSPQTATNVLPNFSSLVSDSAMQLILARRWAECVACIEAGAPMAATVMMGGLLEGLLLARFNKEPNQKAIHTASAAPKDRSGSTIPLKEWMLKSFIEVAHELGWISRSAKDVGAVLRDYRNYIHPQKELSHGVTLRAEDAALLWEIAKSIAKEVLK